ncbi:MAG: hypothetical protein LUQ38_02665 [Methanotrichaceae archaeon]|nr:hypothetical protein [Methanotrichaceae archaeon]
MKLPIGHSARKRPFGVSVIIFMILAYVLLLVLVVFFSLKTEATTASLWLVEKVSPPQSYVVLLIIILFELAIALGLWRLQRWAWMVLMIWQGLLMAMDIWGRINGNPSHLSMIINIIIVFYINQREVKKAFSGRTLVGEKWTI